MFERKLRTLIQGWDLPRETYLQAQRQNRLATISIELSNICNLSCSGCFTMRVEDSWTERGKKRLPNEMSFEDQVSMLEEAESLGAKTVDIVGAGEPTLDPRFIDIVDVINGLGMTAVVFTHGAQEIMSTPDRWKEKDVSFFFKLWSLDTRQLDSYVRGSVPDYALKSRTNLERFIAAGFAEGPIKEVDGQEVQSTRIGADVLVRKSNYSNICAVFSYVRFKGLFPIIKTYIPEGPTRFSQEQARLQYSPGEIHALRSDEVSPKAFLELRREIEKIDWEMFGNAPTHDLYVQGSKCTQSMASLYVTIQGDIRSCVGTHLSYGRYQPGMLAKAIADRKERVGFGCRPRLEEAQERGISLPGPLKDIYGA